MNTIKILFLLLIFSLYSLCNKVFAQIQNCGDSCLFVVNESHSCMAGTTCIGYKSTLSCSPGPPVQIMELKNLPVTV